MSIRRCKKRTNLVNDARIKSCITRYHSGSYTLVQFLRAVSHSVGAHAVPAATTDAPDTDDDDNQDVNGSNQLQSVCPVSARPSQDMCEVCLVEQRDARLAFVPCGHQRFCASCVAHLEQQEHWCPICRSQITRVLRLYWSDCDDLNYHLMIFSY